MHITKAVLTTVIASGKAEADVTVVNNGLEYKGSLQIDINTDEITVAGELCEIRDELDTTDDGGFLKAFVETSDNLNHYIRLKNEAKHLILSELRKD